MAAKKKKPIAKRAASSKKSSKHVPGRPFRPGQSGNPTGRPKGKGLAKYIREKTKDGEMLVAFWFAVVERKSSWGFDGKTYRLPRSPSIVEALKAAEQLADRGFGKPKQSMELDLGDETRDAFADAAAEFTSRIGRLAARKVKQ